MSSVTPSTPSTGTVDATSDDSPHARGDERAALADDFERLGPTAPTILPGWDALELLDHLLHRERFPHLMLGSRLPGALGEKARAADDRFLALSWGRKVDLLREGPSLASPVRHADRLSGGGELIIHHEDLLRAQDDWSPRDLDARTMDDAWRSLQLMSRAMLRVPVDVTLVSPRGGLHRPSRGPHDSRGALRVHGDPLELLLWVSGRDDVARVRIDGDEGALQALAEGRRGF